jgi:hypothetical protein
MTNYNACRYCWIVVLHKLTMIKYFQAGNGDLLAVAPHIPGSSYSCLASAAVMERKMKALLAVSS